jgi:hypothetical protein
MGLLYLLVAALRIMPTGLSWLQRLGCPVLRWSVGLYCSTYLAADWHPSLRYAHTNHLSSALFLTKIVHIKLCSGISMYYICGGLICSQPSFRRMSSLPLLLFICQFHIYNYTLTLSIRVEYIYSAVSHASCPDGALIIRDVHKVLKWAGTGDFKV